MTAEEGGSKSKANILCLHGYLQNSEVFKAKAGSLRKALKSRAELHFINAPHLVKSTSEEARESGGTLDEPRGWWTWQDRGPGMRPSLAAKYSGWDASLDVLLAALEEVKPDGIIGFSQGATAAALLLAHLIKENLSRPKFAVLIAGFFPRDEEYAKRLDGWTSRFPALIVHGSSDALVPLSRSLQLQGAIERGTEPGNIQRYDHEGGHLVPTCTGNFKTILQTFIDESLKVV